MEQHRKTGAILKAMYLDSMTLMTMIFMACPRNSKIAEHADHLHRLLIKFKSDAENQMFKDYPWSHDASDLNIYYGASRESDNKIKKLAEGE